MNLELLKPYITNKESVKELLESMGFNISPQYKFKDNPSMSIRNDGFIKDFGNSSFAGGDLLDFIQYEFNEQLHNSIERLSNILNINKDNSIVKHTLQIEKKEDKEPLKLQQQKIINLTRWIKTKYQNKHYLLFSGYPNTKQLKLKNHKLWQRETISLNYIQKLRYINDNIIVYDEYFKCEAIILKDSNDDIVDLVRYRPINPKGTELPKYLQQSNEYKPIKRGDNFLYPFQKEMEKLVKENGFIFIGEGLKNSLNALLYSVPYLSIESASFNFDNKFKGYIQSLKSKSIKIIGAFDGDNAGEKVYLRFCNEVYIIDNLFAFNSGIDFTDYIVNKEVLNA